MQNYVKFSPEGRMGNCNIGETASSRVLTSDLRLRKGIGKQGHLLVVGLWVDGVGWSWCFDAGHRGTTPHTYLYQIHRLQCW